MSTGLPDFNAATAWLDVHGVIWERLGIATQADQFGPEWASGGSPWEPLRTADEWVKRIDRDKLAGALEGTMLDEAHLSSSEAEYLAQLVVDLLPDLMGGAS